MPIAVASTGPDMTGIPVASCVNLFGNASRLPPLIICNLLTGAGNIEFSSSIPLAIRDIRIHRTNSLCVAGATSPRERQHSRIASSRIATPCINAYTADSVTGLNSLPQSGFHVLKQCGEIPVQIPSHTDLPVVESMQSIENQLIAVDGSGNYPAASTAEVNCDIRFLHFPSLPKKYDSRSSISLRVSGSTLSPSSTAIRHPISKNIALSNAWSKSAPQTT